MAPWSAKTVIYDLKTKKTEVEEIRAAVGHCQDRH